MGKTLLKSTGDYYEKCRQNIIKADIEIKKIDPDLTISFIDRPNKYFGYNKNDEIKTENGTKITKYIIETSLKRLKQKLLCNQCIYCGTIDDNQNFNGNICFNCSNF